MKTHVILCAAWLGFALAVCQQLACGRDTISNGVIQFAYAPSANNIVPTSVTQVGTSVSYGFLQQDLWEVEIRNFSTGVITKITPSAVSGYTFSQHQGSGGKSVAAVWSNIQAPSGVVFQVTMLAETRSGPPAEDFIRFTIAAQIISPATGYSLYAVTYPRLTFGDTAGDIHQTLAVPVSAGLLWKNPCFNYLFVEPDDSYLQPGQGFTDSMWLCNPGPLSMQWIALYYDNDASKGMLYQSTLDSAYYRKELRFKQIKTASTNTHALQTQPRFMPADNRTVLAASPPYPYTVSVISGDWLDAAKRYRTWAMTQPWIPRNSSGVPVPMYNNSNYSSVIRDAIAFAEDAVQSDPAPYDPIPDVSQWSVWETYLSDRINYFGLAAASIPIHVVGWDYNSGVSAETYEAVLGWLFQTGGALPAPIPSNFSNGLNRVTSLYNASVATYFSFDYSKPISPPGGFPVVSWPNSYVIYNTDYTSTPVENFAVKDESSNTKWRPVNNFVYYRQNQHLLQNGAMQAQSLTLDESSQFAVDYVSYVAESTIRNNNLAGAKGMYIDTLSADNPQLSWDSTATHPEGGGTWSTTGRKAMLQALRQNARALVSSYFVISESTNEALLPDLDLTYAAWPPITKEIDGSFTYNGTNFPFSSRVAPLFDAVYHEFSRTGFFAPLVANSGGLSNAQTMQYARAWYGSSQAWGRAPWIGAQIAGTTNTLTNLANQYPYYSSFVTLAKRIINLNKKPVVRDYIVFGERVRSAPTTSATQFIGFQPFLQGDVPRVVVSSFRRTNLPVGSSDTTGGIHLTNWTASSDGFGAAQVINVTIKQADFGFSNRNYTIDLIRQDGTTINLAGPWNFVTQGDLTYLNLSVPELNSQMIYIH